MELLTFFFVVLWGCLNSYLALGRGRNPYLWFLLGILFGPFPLIFLFILPAADKTEVEAPVKSKKPVEIEDDGINISHHAPFDQHDWYYLDGQHQQHGPHTHSEMRKFTRKEIISGDTYVWNEGMSNWKKIKDMPELQQALNS